MSSSSSSSSSTRAIVEATTDVSEKTGTFRWTINNYSKLPAAYEVNTEGPTFTLCGHEWKLCLYPGGLHDEEKDGVALYLHYMSKNPKKLENVRYQVGIHHQGDASKSIIEEETCTFVAKGEPWDDATGDIWGYGNIIPQATLKDEARGFKVDDTVIFECSITVPGKPTHALVGAQGGPVPVPPSTALSDAASLFEDATFADLTFVVQGEDATREFKAHRNIVGARCPGLRGMLTANMVEAKSGTITLDETEPVAFREFLRYIYTDAIPAAALEAMADHLLDLGKKYGVERLVAMCENALASSLTVENAADRLMLANLHDVPRLKKLCVDFFGRHNDQVMATAGFERLCQHPRCGQLLGEVLTMNMKAAGRLSKKRKRDDGAGAGAGAGSGEPSVADIRGMRVAELRAELRKRGLSAEGRKRELARRLEEAVTGGAQ